MKKLIYKVVKNEKTNNETSNKMKITNEKTNKKNDFLKNIKRKK